MLKRLVECKKWVTRKIKKLCEWWNEPRLSLWARFRIASLRKCGCANDARVLRDTCMISLIAHHLDEDGGHCGEPSMTGITLHGYLGSGRVTDTTKDFSYVPLNARSLTAFMSQKRADVVDLNKNPGSACVVETSGLSGGFYQPPNGKSWSDQFQPT